ncbi:PREDICTED: uncharacterized protein LOC100632705 [Amphimedon queenslandica]|uniref:Sodium/calcium exchanger membrane region domain-containing protein n=1 Tax=Amphimedon queenslandica TaxID=400682 RepID=A0A1X7UUC2_AMPQE|nr:PREDICTED: uncharacterized protein LOC100632705 [Amphimedon queenslandica]|eukprot:XP_003386706.1 PREDICTED: uncharacterized protein LOC100632705 [Amphimedon queenslandica]
MAAISKVRARAGGMSFLKLILFLGILVAAVSPALSQGHHYFDIFVGEQDNSNITNDTNGTDSGSIPTCVFGLEPCSVTIIGNIQLILFFGIILGVSAKIISDGAEMLLDLGLPPTIIGGIVLPLLGAVPDSAMIIASGSGNRVDADQQIAVGMGTLAGSTIMLLTIPWVGGLILGRVDIINKQGVDNKCSKLEVSSLWKSGVSVTPDVTYSSIIMIITALPYLIIQGADWVYGAHKPQTIDNVPSYIKYSAIATSVICFIFFVCYLVYLVVFSAASKRIDEWRGEKRRKENLKRNALKQMLLFQKSPKPVNGSGTSGGETENKPLIGSETGIQKKYFSAWKVHKKEEEGATPTASPAAEDEVDTKGDHEEGEEPKWKIGLWSAAYLIVGVGLVTIFSDPMVDALTRLVNKENENYSYTKDDGHKVQGQYIPIPVFYLSFVITPLCSNASELVSSLIFASKKKKVNTSMTFSQLYGAATMNNTLCLGIFTALVGIRGLTWQYSAEVTVILLVQLIMAAIALSYGFLYKHTYMLLLVIPVFLLYFGSILVTWMLETLAHWK